MSVLVTGGAGFIGSCVVRTLNDAGCDDIIIVDNIASTEKWKNIENKKFRTYFNKNMFLEKLNDGVEVGNIESIIHMGACSSTTETNFDYLWRNNVEYTKRLWQYSVEKQIPIIYASSAATYGDGSQGFDDKEDIDRLIPLNGYGFSKQAFDMWEKRYSDHKPPQHVGLKFFNVYGPNEYFKGSMASMVFHGFNQIKETGKVRLFKSYDSKYADGDQIRDFVYVKDVCDVIMWFMKHKDVSGLYNVGTGNPGKFHELVSGIFAAMGIEENIEFIDMPENLKKKYQYYTCADMKKLRDVGYNKHFKDIKAGTCDYVIQYLKRGYLCY